MPALGALSTLLAVLVGTGTSAQAAPTPCAPKNDTGLWAKISSPKAKATVDFAETPQIDVAGKITGASIDKVSQVDIYADGVLINSTKPQAAKSGGKERFWSISATPPAGQHDILVCARATNGQVAGDSVNFTVKGAAPSATIVAPDVAQLTQADISTITSLTDTTIVFTSKPALEVGSVLAVGMTAQTPKGLLRRVTAIGQGSGKTTVTTEPSSLTDAIWQTDIEIHDVPLSETAARKTEKAGTSVVEAGFKGEVGASLELRADVELSVGVKIEGWKPKVYVKKFLVKGTGAAEAHAEGEFYANAKYEWEKKGLVPDRPLTAIPIPVPLPIPLAIIPILGVDAKVEALSNSKLTFGASASGQVSVGAQYSGDRWSPIAEADLTASVDSPLNTDGKLDIASDNTAKVMLTPRVDFTIDTVLGPRVATPLSLTAGLKYPCSGSYSIDASAQGEIGGTVRLINKDLAQLGPFTVFTKNFPIASGHAPGCDAETPPLTIKSGTLPDGETGKSYDTVLQATGAKSPYSWRITSGALPEGLNLTPEGKIHGRPTAAGDAEITVEVTDAAGIKAQAVLTISVKTATLVITTPSLPDGFVGIEYDEEIRANGGRSPYRWEISGLPDGLGGGAGGEITGVPTVTGSSTVQLKVTDASNISTTAELPLIVGSELPPSVVDLPEGTPVPPPDARTGGASWGDPHLSTFDGRAYDFQTVGEFVALESVNNDFQVQVRQQPFEGSRVVSGNVGVTMKVGTHRVTTYVSSAGLLIRLDGTQVTPTVTGLAIAGGGSVKLEGNRGTVTWPDGSYVAVDAMNGSHLNLALGLSEARLGKVRGLLGNADGVQANDVVLRDGTNAAPGDDAFIEAWRVQQTGSLFDYAQGESTATFTDKKYPYGTISVDQIPQSNRDAAQRACQAVGVTETSLLDGCVLDVALSGNPDLAVGAAVAQLAPQSRARQKVIATSKLGDAWTDPSGRSGQAKVTFGHTGCVAVNEQSRCTGGVWLGQAGASQLWDLGAAAVWSGTLTQPNQDTVTFTQKFLVTSEQASKPAQLDAWADDVFSASLNGNPVLSGTYDSAKNAPIQLVAGLNTLTFTAVNLGGFNPQDNPAGALWAVSEV